MTLNSSKDLAQRIADSVESASPLLRVRTEWKVLEELHRGLEEAGPEASFSEDQVREAEAKAASSTSASSELADAIEHEAALQAESDEMYKALKAAQDKAEEDQKAHKKEVQELQRAKAKLELERDNERKRLLRTTSEAQQHRRPDRSRNPHHLGHLSRVDD